MFDWLFKRTLDRWLDNSKAAQSCDWMAPVLAYEDLGDNRYQVLENWWCQTGLVGYAFQIRRGDFLAAQMDNLGLLTVFAGDTWDGPSDGPWIFQTRNTPDSMKGSLVHDKLYEAGRDGSLPNTGDMRRQCDDIFYRINRSSGMYRWRARMWWAAVRQAANGSYCPQVRRRFLVGKSAPSDKAKVA
jgi:hypothetical protein